jgi:SAM-dependent methyltransferase
MADAALFPHMLPILRDDGTAVGDLRSAPSWKALKQGASEGDRADAAPISAAEFLDEEHHRAYGRPWVMGRYYVDQLIELGLDPAARVLDLGCGAGRVGIWLVPYLEDACYCGVDNHLRSLVAFAGYENFLHRLWPRRPRLMLSGGFEVAGFGERFDVALDFFVLAHLEAHAQQQAVERIARVCGPGARLYTLQPPAIGEDAMRAAGFELVDSRKVAYPLLADSPKPSHASDHWFVFARVGE